MPENAATPVLVEYDVQRPFLRLLFGLLEGIAFVAYQHGYQIKFPQPTCNGGSLEAFGFLVYLGAIALSIEVIHWIIWRIIHRKEILSFHEQQMLFGKTTILGVHHRGLEQSGVQELFGSRLIDVEAAPSPTAAGPKDYELVESGGTLPLVPRNPLLAVFFSLGLLAVVLFIHNPGSVDSCAPVRFSWPDLFARSIVAYAFLALGSIAESRIVGQKSISSPTSAA